jgi:hypothetical protein
VNAVAERIGIHKLRQTLRRTLRRGRAANASREKPRGRAVRRLPVTGDFTATEAIEEDRAER